MEHPIQKQYVVSYTVTFDGSMEIEASSEEAAGEIVNDQPLIDLYNNAGDFDLTCDDIEEVEAGEDESEVKVLAEALACIATRCECISAIKAIRDLMGWGLIATKNFVDGCKAANDPVREFLKAKKSS